MGAVRSPLIYLGTVFIVDVLVASADERTGNINFSIGLHTGWIFWRSPDTSLPRQTDGAPAGFRGLDKLTDGWRWRSSPRCCRCCSN
jgi:hypothetical protein